MNKHKSADSRRWLWRMVGIFPIRFELERQKREIKPMLKDFCPRPMCILIKEFSLEKLSQTVADEIKCGYVPTGAPIWDAGGGGWKILLHIPPTTDVRVYHPHGCGPL